MINNPELIEESINNIKKLTKEQIEDIIKKADQELHINDRSKRNIYHFRVWKS